MRTWYVSVCVCLCFLVCLCVDFQSKKLSPRKFCFFFSFLARKLFANFAVFEVDMLPLDATLNKSSSSRSSSTSWCLIMMMMGSGSRRSRGENGGRMGDDPQQSLTNRANESLPWLGCSAARLKRICISCQVITWWWATNKPSTWSRHQFKPCSN